MAMFVYQRVTFGMQCRNQVGLGSKIFPENPFFQDPKIQ